MAEFEIMDGYLEPVDLGPNRRANRSVWVHDGRIQLGLTQAEIRGLERRIQQLLREVDRGRIKTF